MLQISKFSDCNLSPFPAILSACPPTKRTMKTKFWLIPAAALSSLLLTGILMINRPLRSDGESGEAKQRDDAVLPAKTLSVLPESAAVVRRPEGRSGEIRTLFGRPLALPRPVIQPLADGEPWTVATAPESTLSSSSIKSSSIPRLNTLSIGDRVEIPLDGGRRVEGIVNSIRMEQGGDMIVGGGLDGDEFASFVLARRVAGINGMIRLPREKIGYVIETLQSGQTLLQKRPISVLECAGMPVAPPTPDGAAQVVPSGPQAIVVPPAFDSRPSAAAVLYLDFDGETVTDPYWNRGAAIVALPAVLGGAEITNGGMIAVCEAVAEDFAGFNISVTSIRARYDAAAKGSRMRCIVTPTKTAAPSAGGVAYINSFSEAGSTFTGDIPCWSFNSNNVAIMAMTISHELGHTVGLSHDGTLSDAYYSGHGVNPVSWGPIMGAPFFCNLVNWSKGEYFQANNPVEDDNAIISSAKNKFGFRADDYSSTRTSALLIDNETGSIDINGVVERQTDVDYFKVNSFGGPLTVTVAPSQPVPSFDSKLEIYDSTGALLAVTSDVGVLSSTLSIVVPRGTYFIAVSGGAEGTPTVSPPSGWTNYGSQGQYRLTGTFVPLPDIPLVTLDPVAQAINEGSPAVFTVAGTCRGPIRYQWQKDGVNISGATAATYKISRLTPANQGLYRCKLTNGAGDPLLDFVYSAEVALDVRQKPRITSQPVAVSALQSDNVSFTVAAVGYAPLLYQWQKNNVDIVGETNDTLNLSNVQVPDIASYRVRITNDAGFIYSSAVKLAVSSAPFILVPPQDLNLVVGSSGRFSVKAAGDARLSYQWLFEGAPIARATGTTLTVKGTVSSIGSYSVAVTNPKGTTTSASAALAIFDRPVITSHPASATVLAGTAITLAVAATGTDLHYQWQYKRVNIPAATGPSLELNPVTWFDAGAYRCIVSNAAASATSREATVKVISAPIITTEPADTKVARKKNAIFRVVATGTPTLKYQWMKNGVDILRATGATLTVSRADAENEGNYSVRITNPQTEPTFPGVAAVVSRAASLTVEDPPVITVQPESNKYFAIGSPLTLSVAATGSPTLLYQWQKSNVNLVGQTGDTLTIPAAAVTDSGQYRVLVKNDVGQVYSRTVSAFVIVGPSVVTHPLSQSAYVGDTITLSVVAAGGKPLTYQWRKDGIIISRATSSTYRITNAQLTHAGSYDVVVTNPVGSVTSNPAVLSIDAIPTPVVTVFTPTRGRRGSKVEITGQNLRWTTSVKIGSKVAAFVKTGDDVILATVAPGTVDGPVVVTTKGGTATTVQNFTVTTADENDDLADSVILTGTGTSFQSSNFGFTREFDEPFHAGLTTGRSAWWRWTCPKSGRYAIDLFGSGFDTVLAVYRPSATISGYGGFISEAYNDDFASTLTSRVLFTAVKDTVYYTSVSAYGGGSGGSIIFSQVTKAQSPPAPEGSFDLDAGFVSGNTLSGQKDWVSDNSAAVAVEASPASDGQIARLGGVGTASQEPVFLWKTLPDSVTNSGRAVHVSFDANLELPEAGTSGDRFGWSIYNKAEKPLLALWMAASDGSMHVVNAAGDDWEVDAKLVDGAAQRFEIDVDPASGTWALSIDGVSMFDGLPLGLDSADSNFGDVTAIWLPDPRGSAAALVFDNFSVTTDLTPAEVQASEALEIEAAAQVPLSSK